MTDRKQARQEQCRRMLELRAAGMTLEEIGKAFNCSKQNVSKMLGRYQKRLTKQADAVK